MKLINITDNQILLEVETTGGNANEMFFPKEGIHHWYPFNVNFFYKYTEARDFLYLSKETGYEGENYYNVDILKRTKPLTYVDGVMYHPEVHERNMSTISQARSLGIPAIVDEYTLEDVEVGFYTLAAVMGELRSEIEDRYQEETGELFYFQEVVSEAGDVAVYQHATESERERLIVFGEIYAMLTVMRKLTEGE